MNVDSLEKKKVANATEKYIEDSGASVAVCFKRNIIFISIWK